MKQRQVSKGTTPKGVLGARAKTRWERVEVFHSGDLFFGSVEAAIREATRSLRIESYIFATDRLGHRMLDLLHDAAKRGVEVRIIIDGIGSHGWVARIRQEALLRGIQVKVFHELPWMRWWRGRASSLRLANVGRAFRRINHRNHRKVFIVDEKVAFVGSMNIIEYHLESYMGAAAWRDTGVRIDGAEVAILVQSFDELWSKRSKTFAGPRLGRRPVASGELVRLNIRRWQRRENYLDILVRMLGAKRRIWIENAYFVPDGSFVRALTVAAQSGVDVRIVVPATSDVVFIPWVTAAFHDGLLRAGARIFEYTKSMLHAKTILVDDWGLVGSSNLNHRSLLYDLEADVVLVEESACRNLESQFEVDCSNAREVTLESWRERPLLERLIGRFLLLLRRLM